MHEVPFTQPIDQHSLIGVPKFTDNRRNLASWDAALGGPGTAQHAIVELMKRNDDSEFNPAYNVAALTKYIAEGYQVQHSVEQEQEPQ